MFRKVAFILILSTCLISCRDSQSNRTSHSSKEFGDSISRDSLYMLTSNLSEQARDSMYSLHFQELEKVNKFDEIRSHYQYYKTRHGGKPTFLITVAAAYQNLAQHDTALQILQSLLEESTTQSDPNKLGKVYRGLASNYYEIKETTTAIDLYYKSMEAFKAGNNLAEYHATQVELATVFFFLKDFPRSLELHTKANEYFTTIADSAQMAYTYDGMTVALDNLDRITEADTTARKSLSLYKSLNDLRGQSVALTNLAHIYKRRGKLAQAEPFLREGLTLMERANDDMYIPVCQSRLGSCLLELNKLDEAEYYLNKALERFSQNGSLSEAAQLQFALSRLSASKGDYKTAFQHQSEHIRIRDTLNSRERLRILAESAERYEIKTREAEISQLKLKNELNKVQQKLIIGTSLALILLISGALYARFRRQKAILDKEKEILLQKAKTRKAELKLAKTELESFAQSIQEKSRLLAELEEKFRSTPEVFTNPVDAFKSVAELYNRRILTDSDWERYKEQFDTVYPGYSAKLRATYPEISQAELRLLLLMKINLESREIAETLGVSIDTVKKTRQRVRRRLGLAEDEKLEEVVRKF